MQHSSIYHKLKDSPKGLKISASFPVSRKDVDLAQGLEQGPSTLIPKGGPQYNNPYIEPHVHSEYGPVFQNIDCSLHEHKNPLSTKKVYCNMLSYSIL